MLEQIMLGMAQGIAEWLPVSSEGVITLLKVHLFPSNTGALDIIKAALFLHLGTALAAVVYFHKDIFTLIKGLFSYKETTDENKKVLLFLILSTILSGMLGIIILKLLPEDTFVESQGRIATLLIGIMLLITAGLQFWNKNKTGERKEASLTPKDAIILGIAQGFTPIPGLSRSGTTVAALLLLNFDKKTSLRLSFLMSIPIVFAGNIVLNIGEITSFSPLSLAGLASSFIFGIITIDILLRVAQRINFGYFVLFFALLTLAASVI